MYRIGIDAGSTTLKIAVLDKDGSLIYSDYQRHYSDIKNQAIRILSKMREKTGIDRGTISISGSAGIGIADNLGIPFVQEVYATREAARTYLNHIDVIIELGGEDAKVLFLTGGLEVRMNGTCAGGTGAFIDQMATLLGIEKNELGRLAEKAEEIHTIASRCGVFAKSDIQPLINQGARTADIAASILVAVVNQTIGGLAQGREIKGNIAYLGGPLTFIPQLRFYFDKALDNKGVCPDNSLFYVAMGTALSRESKLIEIEELEKKLKAYKQDGSFTKLPPLFNNSDEYQLFRKRHIAASIEKEDPKGYKGNAYLGIDAGSTTIKCCLLSENGKILLTDYQSNNGEPVEVIRETLRYLYKSFPDIHIMGSASTGYGEALLKTALTLDYSLIETEAHFIGAKHFLPEVDFIIDIGGQDIKCFKIKDGVIDDIFLNEACSSGCGSFLETFAKAMNKSSEEFAELAIKSEAPVDLGSRCTVFMNSSVKQAQKDGALIEDISAGLAISIVKNAIYKVIRASSAKELGKNIVVQGGTFLNDAVLRAFEIELGCNVIRTEISGLMGAYGAALYSMRKARKDKLVKSSILSLAELESLDHTTKTIRCKGCFNRCLLTINDFKNGRKLISGNKCQKPITGKSQLKGEDYNLYEYKRLLLSNYFKPQKGKRGKLGLPLALGIYELLPFYYTLFSELGYEVIVSGLSNRKTYVSGQSFVPSDTVCFPAKLMHGHIEKLKELSVDHIFIPCSSYNIDEEKGTNHFNCPVVAYYGEVIKNNHQLKDINLILAYISLANKKHLKKRLSDILDISEREISPAVDKAYKELELFRRKIEIKGKEIVDRARKEGRRIIVLAGRPYHVDPEISHGIDLLITEIGFSVITEDSISAEVRKRELSVLNQWTYHSRMYLAAEYVSDKEDMELVQLVSFGCGLDAVTTDEIREILRAKGKIYTQLKIDEITNMGAVRIRLRSLLAALEAKE